MDSNSIGGGVVKGITQAIVWALLILAWQYLKAYKIRRDIRKSFVGQKASSWRPPNLFGILVRNSSAWPVTIRSAGFMVGPNKFTCGYLGNKDAVYDNHILLKSETEDTWGLPIQSLARKIEAVWLEIEFDTVFGNTKIERLELGGEVAQFLEEQRVQLRKQFQLPPFEELPSHPALVGA
ncbi:MAG: hypothetical protein JWR69_2653 [Pedosphaera sp.]|nr:hypothetical protein [Pedosphaera sp.]